ncbi:unnamed protein product [Soboliphyme baturini]|uniref:Uncharacterized protein n=1 Tax=Soboliphyme baturini TaxID=241478 RepID=A0A183IXV5_9BILA|nr:unnamed protein product [Soboliphyme baturini]
MHLLLFRKEAAAREERGRFFEEGGSIDDVERTEFTKNRRTEERNSAKGAHNSKFLAREGTVDYAESSLRGTG